MASTEPFTFKRRNDKSFAPYRAYDVSCPGKHVATADLGVVYLDKRYDAWVAATYPGPVRIGMCRRRQDAAALLHRTYLASLQERS